MDAHPSWAFGAQQQAEETSRVTAHSYVAATAGIDKAAEVSPTSTMIVPNGLSTDCRS
jgi:hypothetical protein